VILNSYLKIFLYFGKWSILTRKKRFNGDLYA
jgi:hypothetical protein